MKKTYSNPQMEIVEIQVNRNLMLVVSNSEVPGNDALSPSFSDEELEGYFGQVKANDTSTLA